MRYWKKAIETNLTFDEAKQFMEFKKGFYFATRPEWQGFHYIGVDGKYRVLFKDGHYEILDASEVWAKDKADWMIVTIKPEAYRLLKDAPNGGILCHCSSK